ncbi:MAG: CRISPR-associated endonuclease Cas3'' [Nitrososphaerales archaeon]
MTLTIPNTLREYKIFSYKAKKEGGLKELYIDHICICLDIWEKLYKKRTLFTIAKRIASILEVDYDTILRCTETAFKYIIAHHDLGKLTRIYQDYCYDIRSLKGFRHEHVSAYIILNSLIHELEVKQIAYLATATVYLHHEAQLLTMSSRIAQMLRAPTMELLLACFKNFEDEEIKWVEDSYKIVKWLNEQIGTKIELKFIDKNELIKNIALIIHYIDGSPIAPSLRLLVASFLLPLTLVDDEAAKRRAL